MYSEKYSTLKTEEKTNIAVNLNIPFELTTARDKIMRDSEYNKKLIDILFTPKNGCKSLFGKTLENIISLEKVRSFWTCLSGDIKAFINFFNELNDKTYESRINDIKTWNLFDPHKRNIYISLNQGYSVEEVIYKYNHEVDEKEICTDIEKWLNQKCQGTRSKSLIDVSNGNYMRFERLVNSLGLDSKTDFPLLEMKNKSVMLAYFKDEYENQ